MGAEVDARLPGRSGFEIDPAASPGFTARMKYLLVLALLSFGWSGCQTPSASYSSDSEAAATAASTDAPLSEAEAYPLRQKLLVTPDANLLVGTVALYNAQGRFVVLDFPVGKMPAHEQVLFVYRRGLKVGEVRVTGPERDHKTVADLVSGEAQKGDEVCNQ